MNPKKMKLLFFMGVILLIIVCVVYLLSSNLGNKRISSSNSNDENIDEYSYNFSEDVDLDTTNATEYSTTQIRTDFPDLGIISDYYENTDIVYHDYSLEVPSYEGNQTIAAEWIDEGFAKYVKEPEFGYVKKFILAPSSMSVTYTNVTMKDTVSYIKELKKLGFNNVIKDERDDKTEYYVYVSENDEGITATLNYKEGTLLIMVY